MNNGACAANLELIIARINEIPFFLFCKAAVSLDEAVSRIDCYHCSFDSFLIPIIVSINLVVAAGTFTAPKAVIIIIIINAAVAVVALVQNNVCLL